MCINIPWKATQSHWKVTIAGEGHSDDGEGFGGNFTFHFIVLMVEFFLKLEAYIFVIKILENILFFFYKNVFLTFIYFLFLQLNLCILRFLH